MGAADEPHDFARPQGESGAVSRDRRRSATGRVWKRSRSARRVVSVVLLCLMPVVLLAAIGFGIVYVRLANGPVSLSYLKPAIERQIAEKLGGVNVAVRDVILSLVERRAEFQLIDVRLRDDAGEIIAQAPLAAMQIDRAALFRAQVLPTGITLIRPRMKLAYSDSTGLSISFARGENGETERASVAAANASAARRANQGVAPKDQSRTTADESTRITLLRSLAGLLVKMRGGRDGLSLDKIGVRNALIEVDAGGQARRWGMPSGDIEISHRADRSIVSGLATLAEAEGQNVVISFQAEASAETGKVELRTSVRDLQPSAIARMVPEVAALSRMSAPISAEAVFNLASTGKVLDGKITAELGSGRIDLASSATPTVILLENGRVELRLEQGRRDIVVAPSTIRWGGGNELVFGGQIAPIDADGMTGWSIDLKSMRGHLVKRPGGKAKRPLEKWSMRGRVNTAESGFQLDEAIVEVAGIRLLVNGAATVDDESARYRVAGRLGGGPVDGLEYVWPLALARDARDWVRANVTGGKISSGAFDLAWRVGNKNGGASAQRVKSWSQSIVMQGRNLTVNSPLTRLPVLARKALVRIKDGQLEISAPTATIKTTGSRGLRLKRVKFVAPDIYAERPVGRLGFNVAGNLRDGAALLATAPAGVEMPKDALRMIQKKARGKIDGRLQVAVPLYAGSDVAPKLTGKLQISDVRAKDVVASHDLSGGSFNLDLASQSINANGEMLISGVATKLAWQYILDAPLDSQPPVRLDAKLDEADRDKLGIKINNIVQGVVDVEFSLIPRAGGGFGSKVRADVTRATVSVESLAWVKPAGRRMQLEFDVITGKKHPVELNNVRVVGDGVAISGRAMLDKKYRLRAFVLPHFSIDRVTRLQINGRLHKSDIWNVVVKGQTFEGRPLFRSLFQAGRARSSPEIAGNKRQGLDLEADVKTVLGFWNSKLSDVRMSLSKRQGKIQSMQLEGRLADDKLLKAGVLFSKGKKRELHAFSNDAGKALTLVGFYPNARRGQLQLVVQMDGQGRADKTGTLLVRQFRILGDQVVGEMASASRRGIRQRRAGQSTQVRQALDFDWMRVPFSLGSGQFILHGAELRGPVVGATIEGNANFEARRLDLNGTYVPLQGLNGALGVIPGLGQILAGPNGEGVLGMKFAVRGLMGKPEILVNPLSMMAPGIFREIFQITNPSLDVATRKGTRGKTRRSRPSGNWRSGAFGEN